MSNDRDDIRLDGMRWGDGYSLLVHSRQGSGVADDALLAALLAALHDLADRRVEVAELAAENARLREVVGEAQRWLAKLHNADLEEDPAFIGMVFQKDAMRLANELGKAANGGTKAR